MDEQSQQRLEAAILDIIERGDTDPVVSLLRTALKVATQRILLLENAIRAHRSQKADDRCVEDDDRLYEAIGDGVKCDRQVGDKSAMLANCQRFIDR